MYMEKCEHGFNPGSGGAWCNCNPKIKPMTLQNIIEEAKEGLRKIHTIKVRYNPKEPLYGKENVQERQTIEDFLSHSLTKGIQKAMEEIRLEKKPEWFDVLTPNGVIHKDSFKAGESHYGYNQAIDDLDTKINQLLDK